MWNNYKPVFRDLRIVIIGLVLFMLTQTVWSKNAIDPIGKKAEAIRAHYQAMDHSNTRIPGVIYVKWKSRAIPDKSRLTLRNKLRNGQVNSIQSAFRTHQDDGTSLSRISRLNLNDDSVFETIARLLDDEEVEWAEPAYQCRLCFTPSDPLLGYQWYLDTVHAAEAWDIVDDGSKVIIGIVDTGVYYDHPDLAANIWTNPGEIPDNGVDDDGNGYVDDVHGWDLGGSTLGSPDNDPVEKAPIHGTLVAGISSCVTNNGLGVAAPAYNAVIMPVRVQVDDQADDELYWTAEGVVYAADNGADIINCSYGSYLALEHEREAVEYAQSKGALVVAAGGNENTADPLYPAAFPGVMGVAATTQGDAKWFNSNYGYHMDVSAPGSRLYNTWGQTGYTDIYSGTSLAVPLTASIAAMVMTVHPDWTAEQVREQIRISADPIDNLNPGFARQMGYGRVNAYRALTVESPAIRVSDYTFAEEETGNGLFEPGETLLLTITLHNYLEPAENISCILSSDHPDITIENDHFQIPQMSGSSSWQNSGNPIRILIEPDAERGQDVILELNIVTNAFYTDYDFLKFTISHNAIQGGNVKLTLTSMGRLGTADINSESGGEGFVFNGDDNLLYEGAFMAAVDAAHVSDVARGTFSEAQNDDFTTSENGDLIVNSPGILADEQALAVFSDEQATNAIGIEITQRAFAYNEAPDDQFVLLGYSVKNISDSVLDSLFVGLFLDWDVGNNGSNYVSNLPGYDADLKIGYVYDEPTSLYGAAQLLSNDISVAYKAIFNEDELFDMDAYSDEEKWRHLSGGLQPVADKGEGDYSMVIGAGPIHLAPGDTQLVAFALLAGESLEDIRAGAQAALAKWQSITDNMGVHELKEVNPAVFNLLPNYPNPFNPETTIPYEVADEAHVNISIYDPAGREVTRLIDEKKPAGSYQIVWNGQTHHGPVASGVYIIKMKADEFTSIRKMVLIR